MYVSLFIYQYNHSPHVFSFHKDCIKTTLAKSPCRPVGVGASPSPPPPQVGAPPLRSAGCISPLLVVCACPLRRRWGFLKKTILASVVFFLPVASPSGFFLAIFFASSMHCKQVETEADVRLTHRQTRTLTKTLFD